MRNLVKVAVALVLILGTVNMSAQSKKINIQKSTITWVGKKVTGQHTGTLNFQNGVLIFKKGQLKGGNFTVDMNSLVCTDLSGEWKEKLEKHLKSDDFFGTENHKQAKLIFKKVLNKGNGVYTITGDLSIKNISKPITFDITIQNNTASSKLEIDRTKYDIKFKSNSFFENLGDKAIYDDFELTVNLQF